MESKNTTSSIKVDKQKVADIFKNVDENMELDKEEVKELTEFETINKEGKDIEFDKIQVKDL